MVQKVNFNNLTGDTLTVGNTVITGTGVTVSGSPLAGGATQYANTSQLPKQDLTFGEFALIGNTLFITNGVGWYSVGVINQSPNLSISVTDISLGAIGNTINFTYTATDPDGPTPTVTASLVGANSSQANVNLYTSNSTVTVENLSATDFSANIVLTATDGIDQTFGTVTLNVVYLSELWDETVLSIGTSSTNSLNNSTIVDSSTNAHTFTKAGTPTQTAFHPYLNNWSVDFDGNDYLTFADQSDWDFVNSGDFTVDSWIYPRSTSNISWFGQSGGGGSRPDKWGIYINDTSVGLSAGTIGWHLGSNGNIQGPSFTPTANTWYHIRLGREGDVWYFFVDGVLLGTTTSTIRPSQAAQSLRVGADGEAYRIFDGYLSNFRIVKGTNLSTSTFDAVTENLTAVTNTVLLTCQSNRVVDNSTNNYSATFVGDPVVSAFNPFGRSEYEVGENRGSAKFASGDSLTRATTGFYTVTSFCMEFWIYPLSDQTHYICEGTQQGSGTWRITMDSSSGYVGFSYAAGSWAGVNFNSGTGNFNSHEWTHIAITKTSAGVYRIFINGVQKGTQTNTSSLINTARNFQFGYYVDGSGTSYSNALYSDFKITRQDPVYTSDFTVPTAPVGGTNVSINDPYMYLPFDNAGIFDKTGSNTLTTIGDASTSTTQTKFADTAVYFDGTGDRISTQSDNIFNIGTSEFTIEFWIYPLSWTTNDWNTIFSVGLGANGGGILIGKSAANQFVIRQYAVADIVTTSTLPSLNSWTHIACVRSSGTSTIYYNGVSVASASDTANYTTSSPFAHIGNTESAGSSHYYHGYIENLQFLKGVAKYTANFTSPTATQGRIYQAES